VLEKGPAGVRFHGVAAEGVPVRAIAGVVDRALTHVAAEHRVAYALQRPSGHLGHALAEYASKVSERSADACDRRAAVRLPSTEQRVVLRRHELRCLPNVASGSV
jgi:hypothetical protein